MVTVYEGEVFELPVSGFDRQQVLSFAAGFAHPEKMIFLLQDSNENTVGALSMFDLLEEREEGLGVIHRQQGVDPWIQARNLFAQSGAIENQVIPYVNADGVCICVFRYLENRIFGVNQSGTIYDRDFPYGQDKLHLDFTLLERYDTVVIAEWEEYSRHVAGLISQYFPDKKIYSLDSKVSLLAENVIQVVSMEMLEQEFATAPAGRILWIHPDRENEYGIFPRFMTGIYSSLCVMKSIYWCCREEQLGTKNPGQKILLLDYQVDGSGLVDVCRFGASYCRMATERGFQVVMDCRDSKGYLGKHSDQTFWNDYFAPVSAITVEEAMESAHVYRASANGIRLVDWEANPYLYEADCQLWDNAKEGRDNVLRRFVRPCEEVKGLIQQKLPMEFRQNAKILGAVARGTDYRKESLAQRNSGDYVDNQELDIFLSEIRMRMELGGYDKLYLATEDQAYYDAFLQEFGDRMIAQEQKRANGDQKDSWDKSVAELIQTADPIAQNRNYMSILYALCCCEKVYATMECGAYLAALAYQKRDS